MQCSVENGLAICKSRRTSRDYCLLVRLVRDLALWTVRVKTPGNCRGFFLCIFNHMNFLKNLSRQKTNYSADSFFKTLLNFYFVLKYS